MRALQIALLAVCLSSAQLYAQVVPNYTGRVNDFAGVIDADTKNKLEVLINQLDQKTTAEIAVVTLKTVKPYDEFTYARALFDTWKIGKKGKDNGVLILVVTEDRLWRIETGYGLEGILPDGKCGSIGREFMVPYFKQGSFSRGIYTAVTEIARIISGGPELKSTVTALGGETVFLSIFALFFFSLWNIPWPIFIGLPFTLIFASAFAQKSLIPAVCALIGYVDAMVVRYLIWRNQPEKSRVALWKIFVFGLMALGTKGSNWRGGGHDSWGAGGLSGGGGSGGGGGFSGGGFGGGSGGGGGAGGRF